MAKKIIGVVRVPVVRLMCVSSEWRRAFSYPEPTRNDWKGIFELRGSLPPFIQSSQTGEALAQRDLILSTSHCLKIARSMSFYDFLNDRMISEARKYSDAGIRCLLLDFSVDEWLDEDSVYWMFRSFAESFRDACNGDFEIGLRIDEDDWAADIASRFGYDFVVCSDSSGYLNVTRTRNRMTDGTEQKKPRMFALAHCYNSVDAGELMRINPEGFIAFADDEDMLDEFGKTVEEIEKTTGVEIPVIGFYNEEIMRGEMRSDMTEWGVRDYILVDEEARENGYREGKIDSDRIALICGEISKLKQ